MGFFKINSKYLTEKRVKWYFWLDLIIGAIGIAVAMEFHGTKWGVLGLVIGILGIIDAYMLRYFYEIKNRIEGK